MTSEIVEQSEQLFRALIEHSTDAIILITPNGTISYASPAAAHFTGYAAEELVGMDAFALLHPGDRTGPEEGLSELLAEPEQSLPLKCRVRRKDGCWREMAGTATNLLNDPHIGAIVCTFRGISRQTSLADEVQMLCKGETGGWHHLEQQLQYTERRFRSLVESNIVGLMVTDQEGRMYEVNNRLVQLLGYSREELICGDMRVKDLLTAQYKSARIRAWKTLISHGASLPEEKDYVRKDGRTFPALVAAATINQERTRALVMLLDISDRKEVEQRQQEFLSMVSHELKTPLTAIQGFLELVLLSIERLPRTSPTEMSNLLGHLEATLQEARRQTEIETRLVSELLDMSRMEMQSFELFLQECDLITLVQRVVVNQQQVAPTHQIELVLPEQAKVPLVADPDRIEQALTNYLANAFKYAPPDQPIRVELTIEGFMGRVSVRDQGPGLTEKQQQRVWDRFYQIRSGGRRAADGGLGLGLYIVQTIIAQHQGQVGIESQPGQGANFWFMLPLADSE